MKLGEVVVPMCTTTSPSFIKIGLKIKKRFIKSTFFEFLIHLFINSLIFANSLLDDPVLKKLVETPTKKVGTNIKILNIKLV